MNHLGKDVSSLLMISRTGPSNSKTEQQKQEALESTYQKINRYVEKLTNDDFIVFCDGSATPPPSGGAVHGGCWMNNQKHTIETWSISMNVMCDNVTAELAAIHHTLKTALYKKTKLKQNIHCLVILTDCQTALVDIHSPNNHFTNAFTKKSSSWYMTCTNKTPMSNLTGSLVMQTTNAMNLLICWQIMLQHTLKQRMAVWLAIAKTSTWILKTKVKTLPILNSTTDITSTVFKTIWPQLITLSLICGQTLPATHLEDLFVPNTISKRGKRTKKFWTRYWEQMPSSAKWMSQQSWSTMPHTIKSKGLPSLASGIGAGKSNEKMATRRKTKTMLLSQSFCFYSNHELPWNLRSNGT